jgi:hypothetical protein
MKQQKLSGKERHNGKEPYTNAVTNTEQQVYNSCSRIEPQRTTPISRLQKQKRRNLRESSQQLSPRRYFSLLPEQKKQHFESSKHVEDYEYQRDRQTQRETEREKKSLPRRERFISSSYDHHRETPHASLFPSRTSSLVLFPSVCHLSFSRKQQHTHTKHS